MNNVTTLNPKLFMGLFNLTCEVTEVPELKSCLWLNKSYHLFGNFVEGTNLLAYAGYVGEFLERHEERNFPFSDIDKVTVALWYGLTKDYLEETQINDYQIDMLEKELKDWEESISSNMFYFAKYLITKDSSYMEKIKELSPEEYFMIVRISDISHLELNTFELLQKYESAIATTKVLLDDHVDWFCSIMDLFAYTFSHENRKSLKILSTYEKGIEGKYSAKGVVNTLEKIGFDSLKREELNLILKQQLYAGELKTQKQKVACLQALSNSEVEFDEIDKMVISRLCSQNSFTVKMECGQVTSLKDAVHYYNIIENCKNDNNLRYMVEKFIAKNCVVIGWLDFKNLNDEKIRKIKIIDEILAQSDEELLSKTIIEDEISFFSAKEEKTKEDFVNLVAYIEQGFGISIKEMIAKQSYFNSGTRRMYAVLCDYGIFNPVEDLKTNASLESLCEDYLRNCTSRMKFLAVKYLYEQGKSIFKLFREYFFERKDTNENFNLVGCTKEELRQYTEMVLSSALFSSTTKFRNALFNLMLHQKEFFCSIYTEEEIQELYSVALELVETFSEVYSYYSHFSKEQTRTSLVREYMTEEEKARIKAAEEAAELEKKAKAREAAEAIAKEDIRLNLEKKYGNANEETFASFDNYVDIKNSLDYSTKVSNAYAAWTKYIVSCTCFSKKNMRLYMDLVGSLVMNDTITLEVAKAYISKIELVEEVVEGDKHVA